MDSVTKCIVALACVFGAALLGMFVRKQLPTEYQASDSKDVVKLVMGLVVSTVALTLGLLVGSAKNFYDTQNAEMAQIEAVRADGPRTCLGCRCTAIKLFAAL